MAGPWGMLDSKRFNYQHVESYTVSQPASDATCACRITFEADGTLSVQASGRSTWGGLILNQHSL